MDQIDSKMETSASPEDMMPGTAHLSEDSLSTNDMAYEENSQGVKNAGETYPGPSGAEGLFGKGKNKTVLNINSNLIKTVPLSQQAVELHDLGLDVYNQDDLEEGIMAQVDQAIADQERERIIRLTEREIKMLLDEKRTIKNELVHLEKVLDINTKGAQAGSRDALRKLISIKQQKENKMKQLKKLKAKEKALKKCIPKEDGELSSDEDDIVEEYVLNKALTLNSGIQKESEKERLIKMGHMTPFGTVLHPDSSDEKNVPASKEAQLSDFEKYFLNQEQLSKEKKVKSGVKSSKNQSPAMNGIDAKPGPSRESQPIAQKHKIPLLLPKPKKKRKHKNDGINSYSTPEKIKTRFYPKLSHNFDSDPEGSDIENGDDYDNGCSDDEYVPDEVELRDSWHDDDVYTEKKDFSEIEQTIKGKSKKSKQCNENGVNNSAKKKSKINKVKKLIDDSSEEQYVARLREYKEEELWKKRLKYENPELEDSEEESEMEFEGGLKIPGKIWKKLYGYQKTGVRWLWELHIQQVGGIMGDEMGLGKTIQAIAFLAGLRYSNLPSKSLRYQGLGPSIIVCPATVMSQWLKEFQTWWPAFRVAILHDSGSYSGNKYTLMRNINKSNGILITSYSGMTIHQESLVKLDWHYIILDEGHKIRNPDAQVTLASKKFRTPHRLILSGSPIQNSLKELWSLFDFIFPGKLGTLPVFMQQFSVPIVQGGYSNATQTQVQTSFKCATVLRNSINPYLLRRMKNDVKMVLDLPKKNEQVLFCRLTDEQMDVYKQYLASDEINRILEGRMKIFVGLINLRKICNHPDIFTGGPKVFTYPDPNEPSMMEEREYGYWKRSGKMIVVETLLKLWNKQDHKVLIFSQSKQMLDILEKFVQKNDYTYLRMDGSTSIGSRHLIISKFNMTPEIFIFLLTTRVGGLGVNLTGANRVIIFDPDWNPSTDMQARERAWRIGQNRDVCIYRLLTTGAIEEKIYHRQIFKQFLTNRVLKDPKQRRFFKANDLHELFTLGTADSKHGTETGAIFAGTGSEVKFQSKQAKKQAQKVPRKTDSKLPEEKLAKIREMAKKLSQQIGKKNPGGSVEKDKDSEAGTFKWKCESYYDTRDDLNINKLIKNKKRHCDAEFEGTRVAYLDKKDDYKANSDEEDTEKTVKQEEYVLQKLFRKSGIHGAINHDAIMDSSNPDYMIVEVEAERVAKAAVKALKESRRRCLSATSGIPTWTGQNGISGAPGMAKPRFGQKKKSIGSILPGTVIKDQPKTSVTPTKNKLFSGSALIDPSEPGSAAGNAVQSSSQLLAGIKERNLITAPLNDPTADGNVVLTAEHDELLVDIRNFIAFQSQTNGQAKTDEILQKFKSKLPSNNSPLFKAMLNQLCTFERNSEGQGIWKLKSEFR